MRNAIGLGALLLALSSLSCQDSNDEVRSSIPDVSHYKTVGMKIPVETGARWIQAYEERNNITGRTGVAYFVSSADLQRCLASVENLVGMAFHYAIDENGKEHVISIPVDETLRLWTDVAGRIYIDGNSSSELTKATAEAWAERYRARYPNSIWFHYFGRNVFDQILTDSAFSGIDILPAIDDLDQSPELLLVTGDAVNLLGRTTAEPSVYDASYPCPKCEVQ